MLNRKSLTIAKWEVKEKIRRKSFLVFTLIFPALIISLSLLPLALDSQDPVSKSFVIGIVTDDNAFLKTISNISKLDFQENEGAQIIFMHLRIEDTQIDFNDFAADEVLSGRMDGILDMGDSNTPSPQLLHSPSFSIQQILRLQKYVSDAKLILSGNLNTNQYDKLTINLHARVAKNPGIKDSLSHFYYSFSLVVLLVFLTLFTGGTFVRSFLVEKSNGLIEIYLSSCSPKDLMTGKLFGVVTIGLIQIGIWIIAAFIFAGNLTFLSVNGTFFLQILFFTVGYILFSGIFLAAGSIVSSEYQAQQVTAILSIIAVLPILLAVYVMQSPNSTLSIILAYFPITLAPVQILRLASESFNLLQTIILLLIGIVSIYSTIIIASRLFTANRLLNSCRIKLTSFIKTR